MNLPAKNVLVSHRMPLVRSGLIAALSASDAFSVQGCPANFPAGRQAADVIVTDTPSALQLLMDRSADGMCGATPVLMIVHDADQKSLDQARRMGVRGYGSLATPGIALIYGVEALADGFWFCCPTVPMPARHESAVRPHPHAAKGGLAPAALRRVRAHIDAHLSRQLTLDELAAIAHLSQGHFTRAFRQSMGLPPSRYINLRRVALASERIRDADLSLGQIALEAGFVDQSHFSRLFASQMGETPSEFRRRHR